MRKYFYIVFALVFVWLPQNVVAATIQPPRNPGLPDGSVASVIDTITGFVTSIIAVLAILAIVVSGIMYITSGGDQTRVDTAKNWLTYAVIGLVVALMAFLIVTTIGETLGAW